jgi:hypothetical protein
MKKMAKKVKGMSKASMAAVGAGMAAVGAGAYYLLGPNSKKHQKNAAAWMNKMTGEVAQKVKKAGKMSKPIYHKAVDTISREYSKQYKANEKEIKAFGEKLKGEWKDAAQRAVKKSVGKIKKTISKRK